MSTPSGEFARHPFAVHIQDKPIRVYVTNADYEGLIDRNERELFRF